MRVFLILLACVAPAPVTTIGAVINVDQSVTVSWTLPADGTIVGVTILRERIDQFDNDVIIQINGLATSYTDLTSHPDRSYRYWVQTRNGAGELSAAAFVEVIGEDEDHDNVFAECHGTAAGPANALWPLALAAGFAALAYIRPMIRSKRQSIPPTSPPHTGP